MYGLLHIIWQRNNIRYFTIEEVTKGRRIPKDFLDNIEETIKFVDRMRNDLGFPISITSSYRNENFNKLVGGVKNSLHLVFNALDCVPTSGKLEELKAMHDYTDINKTRQMGVGFYPTFIHIDFRAILSRKSPVTWGEKL